MSIIINREIRDNRWSHLADDDPLTSGNVTVTLSRWLQEHHRYAERRGGVGVRLRPGDAPEDVAPFIKDLELIALEFDRFAEGRGYSQACLLRERHGFEGELRALGARRDHVMYMERCGINAFEPAPPDTPADLLEGFDEISIRYQPSYDSVPLIFRKRVRQAADANKERV